LQGLTIKLLVLLLPLTLFALEGKVIKVTDGDTVNILTPENRTIKIRMYGIDAPEKKQAFGNASRKNLADLCAAQNATVQENGRDRYARVVGVVTCNGVEANRKQVQDGYAWAYMQYGGKEYASDEADARAAERGLWHDANPTAPWEWRKRPKEDKK
jgi:endonuclease YncB( thermonuclease family)